MGVVAFDCCILFFSRISSIGLFRLIMEFTRVVWTLTFFLAIMMMMIFAQNCKFVLKLSLQSAGRNTTMPYAEIEASLFVNTHFDLLLREGGYYWIQTWLYSKYCEQIIVDYHTTTTSYIPK